jgi:hypothetical protein
MCAPTCLLCARSCVVDWYSSGGDGGGGSGGSGSGSGSGGGGGGGGVGGGGGGGGGASEVDVSASSRGMVGAGLSDEEQGYIAAWKWTAVSSKKPATVVLMPPITMPAFDVIRVEGDGLFRVCTVPAEVMAAGNTTLDADNYPRINSPTFLYGRDREEESQKRARKVMLDYEVCVDTSLGHAHSLRRPQLLAICVLHCVLL